MEMADGDRFTPEQAEALSALRDGRNVFLSGNAGTGKSYVLNAFISDLKARNVDFLALAPTGIAALNLTDGSTIHRTLKIAPGVCAPDGPKGSRKVLDAAKVIIIDEISMCRIDLFDHVMGMISQSMTRNGAKQVVLVGDFFQLPPVVTERDSALLMKFYPGNLQGWCFKSRYWTGFDFEPHVLKTVVRQSDPDFIDNLNRARVGDASCLDYFNAHSKSSRAYLPKDTLVLCANNRIADSINRENVDALDAPKVEFAAAATGTVSNGDKMAPERIVLCRGARVMSLVNSPQEGYVNGTQGTVTDASADAVTVKFDGVDEKVRIERHRWEINKSEAIVEMDEEGRPVNRVKTAVVGAYTQIPLKLAYAITIHKSQGLTFDACCVHTKVFAEGQLYVGLSRVRSAAGLTVFPKIEPNRLIASREVVEFYDSLERRMEEPFDAPAARHQGRGADSRLAKQDDAFHHVRYRVEQGYRAQAALREADDEHVGEDGLAGADEADEAHDLIEAQAVGDGCAAAACPLEEPLVLDPSEHGGVVGLPGLLPDFVRGRDELVEGDIDGRAPALAGDIVNLARLGRHGIGYGHPTDRSGYRGIAGRLGLACVGIPSFGSRDHVFMGEFDIAEEAVYIDRHAVDPGKGVLAQGHSAVGDIEEPVPLIFRALVEAQQSPPGRG